MSTVHDARAKVGACSAETISDFSKEIRLKPRIRPVEAVPRAAMTEQDPGTKTAPASSLVVVDRRSLMRECFVHALSTVITGNIISFPTIEDWLEAADSIIPSAILVCLSGIHDANGFQKTTSMLRDGAGTPVIFVGDSEDPDQIIEALNSGARGYIPTTLPLSIAVQAVRLITEGGVFVPASSLIAAHRHNGGKSQPIAGLDMFTARQASVIRALCSGKPNKVIAYELNMCESTVKVHVRNIMKKLKAKNRTEVAVMFKGLDNTAIAKTLAKVPSRGFAGGVLAD